jgi:SOS-response transcriptional repressor LexA
MVPAWIGSIPIASAKREGPPKAENTSSKVFMGSVIRNVLSEVKTQRINFSATFRIMEPWQRLRQLRKNAGYDTPSDAAKAFGWVRSTYISHENGTRGLRKAVAGRYEKAFRTKPGSLLYGEERTPEPRGRRGEPDTALRVPLIALISAGTLSDVNLDEAEETILVAGMPPNGNYLAMRVSGDSMDRVSPDGSIIIVDRDVRDPVNGRYYVFSMRGEATYKIYRAGEPSYLEPYSTNPANKPIFIKGKRGLVVVGRVRRTLLDL